MPPHISPWALHQDETGTRSDDGAFALEYVEIANLHLHGYYAMLWPRVGPPTVEVRIAASTSQSLAPAGLAAPAADLVHVAPGAVQSFGRLGGLEIGVIDVPISNAAGQVVAFVVTPPGAPAPTWTLTFLEQVRPQTHPRGKVGLGGDTSTFPELRLGAGLGYPGHRHGGYFALAHPSSPTGYVPSVFFVSDLDGAVTRITEAEFWAGTAQARGDIPAIRRSTWIVR